MKKRTLGTLTKGQLDLFLRQQKCWEVSKKLIREIMHEVEKSEVYIDHIWQKIYKEYCKGLTPEELTKIELGKNGEVYYIEDIDQEPVSELELKTLDKEWGRS